MMQAVYIYIGGIMTRSVLNSVFGFACVMASLAVIACSTNKEYHYWQKTDPTTAIYLTGPKAQQMLEQDISKCVHEIIELDKLASVREGGGQASFFKKNISQKAHAESLSNLPAYDIPEYIRDLRVEHKDFHDFDGCMRHSGWERVKYVDPKAELRAKSVYNSTGEYSTYRESKPVRQADLDKSDAMQREEDELKRR
jgi:hypothetical protein